MFLFEFNAHIKISSCLNEFNCLIKALCKQIKQPDHLQRIYGEYFVCAKL
jgi:hypothetical protein